MISHYCEAIPGWFGFASAYLEAVERAPRTVPSLFVEVGCWMGKSTSFLGVEIANSAKPITLVAVDHFRGSPEHRTLPELASLEATFRQNLAPIASQLGTRFRVLAMPSLDAAALFQRSRADFIWLDASHEQADVEADLRAWLPILKPGGVIGGDDLTWVGVKDALLSGIIPDAEAHVIAHGTDYAYWTYHKPWDD